MKKVQRSTIAIIESTNPSGYLLNTTKSPTDGSAAILPISSIESVPLIPRLSPSVPKIENHTNDARAGASITPIINSRIVLPFEIRAINTPTNGPQAINQAQ